MKRWLLRVGILAAVVLSSAFLFSLPTSMAGLNASVPRVDALAPYKFWGCGVSGSSTATKTHFYRGLKADDRFRMVLREEMLTKGFREEAPSGDSILKPRVSTVYVKSSGGLFPIRSYVIISSDGSVSTGAARSKWPQF